MLSITVIMTLLYLSVLIKLARILKVMLFLYKSGCFSKHRFFHASWPFVQIQLRFFNQWKHLLETRNRMKIVMQCWYLDWENVLFGLWRQSGWLYLCCLTSNCAHYSVVVNQTNRTFSMFTHKCTVVLSLQAGTEITTYSNTSTAETHVTNFTGFRLERVKPLIIVISFVPGFWLAKIASGSFKLILV